MNRHRWCFLDHLWLAMGCILACQAAEFTASNPVARPSVLLDGNELEQLRLQVSKPGWKRDVYRGAASWVADPHDSVHGNAERWAGRAIEIPGRGGHYHNFFCEDGERLVLPAGQKFVPGPYRCARCGKEYEGERYEAALRRMAHIWLSQGALDLALAGAVETNAVFTGKSAEILLKYAQAYPGPHTTPLKGGMIYQSLCEAMWVIPLAQAYDLAHESLTREQQKRIEEFLQVVARGIRSCGVNGNWGSWHLSAVGVVGYAIGDRDLVDWATGEFRKQIQKDLGDDGLWPESVHTYHYYPLRAFLHLAEAAWRHGTDLYRWEARPGKALVSMFTAPLGYAYPDLRLPAINDGWFQAFVPADVYELAWHRIKDPRFAWVLARGYRPEVAAAGLAPKDAIGARRNSLYALLFGAEEIPEARLSAAPGRASVNFSGLGIAILRPRDGEMLTFDYGPHLGHGQPDKMGVTFYAEGKLWAADYGTPGYGAEILNWYKSTWAHNTVVVDGKNQAGTRENRVNLWLEDEQFQAAQSQTTQAYPGVKHTRTVMARPAYVVITDALESESGEEHAYDFCFRSEGSLSIAGGAKGVPADAPNKWISEAIEFPGGVRFAGEWRQQDKALGFVLLGRESVRLTIARCPAETGARLVPMIIGRQKAAAAEFVMVLSCGPIGQELDARMEGRLLHVEINGRRETISLPSCGERPAFSSGRIEESKGI